MFKATGKILSLLLASSMMVGAIAAPTMAKSNEVGSGGDRPQFGSVVPKPTTPPKTANPVDETGDWVEETAEQRQVILVSNPSGQAMQHVPVQVALDVANVKNVQTVSFYDADGTQLAYELAEYNALGNALYWVNIPTLTADTTSITVYYGENGEPDADGVWPENYEVVQHFDAGAIAAGLDATGNYAFELQTRNDSPGLTSGTDEYGNYATFNGNERLRYSAEVLTGATEYTLSALVGWDKKPYYAGIMGRDINGGVKPEDTFSLVSSSKNNYQSLFNDDVTNQDTLVETPVELGTHLVTTTYQDGTLSIYVDGELKNATTKTGLGAVKASTNQFTIGDYSNVVDWGYALKGKLYEAEVQSVAVSPAEEKVRYMNRFNPASMVTYLPTESKRGELVLELTSPSLGVPQEAGNITVTGLISRAVSDLSYTFQGETVSLGALEQGPFSLTLTTYALGEQPLTVTAVNRMNADDVQTLTLPITVVDTIAPALPEISDSAVDGVVSGTAATLTASMQLAEQESAAVRFYGENAINLNAENTVVYTGTYDAQLPTGLALGTGTAAPYGEETRTTVGTGEATPYQMYEVSLSEAEQDLNRIRFSWTGNTGERERSVTAFVYNYATASWEAQGSAYATETDAAINVTLSSPARVISPEGKLNILIWRGMTQDLAEQNSFIPTLGEYDFNFMWMTDTQHYSQNPEFVYHAYNEFQWITDNFEATKSKLMVHTGDIVNVWNDRNQWDTMDRIFKDTIEKAGIPHLTVNGNHDVEKKGGPDGESIYWLYFNPDRLQQNNPYYGGSNGGVRDARNYYYVIEEEGAKILLMALGVDIERSDVEWANSILAAYPDYTAMIMTHDYLTDKGEIDYMSPFSDVRLIREVVETNANIKLVISGHDDGANTRYEEIGGRPVFSLMHDYQSEPEGGLGLFRMLKFDVENNLIYNNTYSDSLKVTEYYQDPTRVDEGAPMYTRNKDEYVISVDFEANVERELTTSSFVVSGGGAGSQIGETQQVSGTAVASVDWQGLAPATDYAWYATVTDPAGNRTTTGERTFVTDGTPIPQPPTDPEPPVGTLPEITNLTPTVNKNLIAGKSLLVEFDADPGLRASFSLKGVVMTGQNSVNANGANSMSDIPMMEQGEGHYVGYYTATVNIVSPATAVEVKATNAEGKSTWATALGRVWINAAGFPGEDPQPALPEFPTDPADPAPTDPVVFANITPSVDREVVGGESVVISFNAVSGLKRATFSLRMPPYNFDGAAGTPAGKKPGKPGFGTTGGFGTVGSGNAAEGGGLQLVELPLMEIAPGYYVGVYTATNNLNVSGAEIELKAINVNGKEYRTLAPGKLWINATK